MERLVIVTGANRQVISVGLGVKQLRTYKAISFLTTITMTLFYETGRTNATQEF